MNESFQWIFVLLVTEQQEDERVKLNSNNFQIAFILIIIVGLSIKHNGINSLSLGNISGECVGINAPILSVSQGEPQ